MGLNEILKIGDKIKIHRKKLNLTQADIAKKLGIPRSTYANYENNTREPDASTLIRIATALEISINNLLGGVEKLKNTATEIELIDRLLFLYGYEMFFYTSEELIENGNVTTKPDGNIDFSESPWCSIKLHSKKLITLTVDEFEEFKSNIKKLIEFELYKLEEKRTRR